ncbi:hypothetical protein BT96DRAFT_995972 [Gymnopus androsaceus JB14]|uniref:F-box domain-containing protein n=1 Tax=Gymnopus androsaceus JB14 TaxID=1447944 RepID=A0A6A4HFG4_9AGAR|nr:hypothetical protein BT96DRAFT_995972 [Gymnopus androsaceus JB14]
MLPNRGTEEVYNLSLLEDPADAESRFWPALELSWVCSFWRTFVHSRPNLWSTLRISSKALDTPGVLEIFTKYILYSGDNLLDFRYDVPARSMENHIDGMGILLKNSTRWRRAILNIPSAPGAAGKWLRIFTQVLEFIQSLHALSATKHPFQPIIFPGRVLLSISQHITELSLVSFTGKSFGHLLCRLPVLKILEVKGFLLSEDAEGMPLSNLEAWRFLRLPCLTDLGILTEDHPLSLFEWLVFPVVLQQALFNFMAPHHLSIVNLAINIEITQRPGIILTISKTKGRWFMPCSQSSLLGAGMEDLGVVSPSGTKVKMSGLQSLTLVSSNKLVSMYIYAIRLSSLE